MPPESDRERVALQPISHATEWHIGWKKKWILNLLNEMCK